MSQLLGMWYGRLSPTYHGLQSMSVLMFFSPRTALLYDLAVIGPLMLRRALVANIPSMKPICANACGAIFVYLSRICSINRVSGPCDAGSRLNSWLINIFPSNCGNCPAMNVLAIGVDEPHFTL